MNDIDNGNSFVEKISEDDVQTIKLIHPLGGIKIAYFNTKKEAFDRAIENQIDRMNFHKYCLARLKKEQDKK